VTKSYLIMGRFANRVYDRLIAMYDRGERGYPPDDMSRTTPWLRFALECHFASRAVGSDGVYGYVFD